MKNVAIIGGGMAGLAAAAILRQKHKVTLFEANGRLGGRAFAELIGGDAMDWGCEALEAGDKAPTAALKAHGTVLEDDDVPDDEWPGIRRLANGGEEVDLSDATAEKEMTKNVKAAEEQVQAFLAKRDVGEAQARLYYKDVASKLDDVTAGVDLEPGPNRIDALLCGFGSFSESSALGESSAFDRARCQYIQDKGGFAKATTYFKEGLGNAVLGWAAANVVGKANVTVHLNRPITLIRNVSGGVEVVPQLLAHGAGVVFDAVVVTVPTGVVSSGALTINDLSGEQMAAFHDCPLGYYHKVVMTGVADLDHPETNKRLFMCDKDLTYAFYLSASRTGKYYMAHVAGEQAVYCNTHPRWTEETLVAMLQELNPDADFSHAVFRHSTWHTDERIRGAYSYSVKGKGLARETLNRLTVGRIYFAGEACSLIWYGGLAGAWETGEDAAKRVIAALG